jgi:multiple sugar transport system permease protein
MNGALAASRHEVAPRRLHPEVVWGAILTLPYLVVFLAFVVYPILFGIWLGSSADGYRRLFEDPIYLRTLRNTLLFLAVGVNLKLFLGLLLSGFFFLPHRWIRWIGVVFILPWAVPSIPTILSFRWMLNSEWGMLNSLLEQFGIGGPWWLLRPNLALAAAIAIHIWKFLPFWTLIFLAARMGIPREVYDSAALDGATGIRGLVHVTFPLVSGIYLAGTLLSTLWTLGDFNSIYLLTGGGPVDATHVLATLGVRYAFLIGDVRTGVSVVMTAVPFLVPLAIYLLRLLGRITSA